MGTFFFWEKIKLNQDAIILSGFMDPTLETRSGVVHIYLQRERASERERARARERERASERESESERESARARERERERKRERELSW